MTCHAGRKVSHSHGIHVPYPWKHQREVKLRIEQQTLRKLPRALT